MKSVSLKAVLSDQRLQEFGVHLKTQRNLSPLTIRAYLSDLKGVQSWLGLPNRADSEVEDDSRNFEAYLRDAALSGSYRDTTIKRKIATTKVFAKHLLEQDGIELPVVGLRRLRYKTEERLPVVMTDGEYLSFIRSVHDQTVRMTRGAKSPEIIYRAYRDRALFELLCSTAVRIGELSSANVEDISLENRTILIRGKGRRQRLLGLTHATTLHEIESYLTERARIEVSSNALFLSTLGKRLSIHAIGRLFAYYLKAARIERHITPHAMRHTVATGLLKDGADIRIVQAILGHSSILMTQRYTHVNPTLIADSFTRYSPRNHVEV